MRHIIAFLLISLSLPCFGQDCKDLPIKYPSTSAAISQVRDAIFPVKDKLPEGKSQKIVKAEYFSCDGEFGYMIYVIGRGTSFIHIQVPKNVWHAFKNAASSEAYYDLNIRDKYKITLEKIN